MEETIRELLALEGGSWQVSRVADDTVRVRVVSVPGADLVVELEIDVHLDPSPRQYGFTSRLHESDGPSSAQQTHRGRLRYRAAGVSFSLDGMAAYEFDSDLVFDRIEQRLQALEWQPRPGFWDRLLGRAR